MTLFKTLVVVAPLSTLACGGATEGAGPERVEPEGAGAGAGESRGANALGVARFSAVTLSRQVLGVLSRCGATMSSDSVTLDFATQRATRRGRRFVCPPGASEGSGRPESFDIATRSLSEAEARSWFDALAAVRLRRVSRCLGWDGQSFSVTVEEAGNSRTYTDGISFGCEVVAQGHEELYWRAAALFP